MSRFTEAEVIQIPEGICLKTELAYEVFYLGSGMFFRAPAGFISDGVSIPKWLPQWIKDQMPLQQMLRSAVVHDLTRKERKCPKFISDYAFWEAMGVDKVNPFWRTVCTLAVLTNFNRT